MARPQAVPPISAQNSSHPTALIALDSDIQGKVTFSEGCIVHPKAVIHALGGGEMHFGRNCLVEEAATIVHRGPDVLQIGEGNTFMVGCHVESPSITSDNTFQPRSTVVGVKIPNHCTITSGTSLFPAPEKSEADSLPDRTVVHGAEGQRNVRDIGNAEVEEGVRSKHLEYLREILPK